MEIRITKNQTNDEPWHHNESPRERNAFFNAFWDSASNELKTKQMRAEILYRMTPQLSPYLYSDVQWQRKR